MACHSPYTIMHRIGAGAPMRVVGGAGIGTDTDRDGHAARRFMWILETTQSGVGVQGPLTPRVTPAYMGVVLISRPTPCSVFRVELKCNVPCSVWN
jgi:hypothetical protein